MRIVSLLMVLAMLLSFAACNEEPADPVDSGSGSNDANDPANTTELSDGLPDVTLDGMSFDIWTDASLYWPYFVKNEDAEGDVVNEAVTMRNELVSDRFEVALNWNITTDAQWRDMVMFRQSILNGDEYDLHEGVALYSTPLIQYGCFVDMENLNYMDFSDPWWFDYATETFRVADRQFAASGYLEFPTVTRTMVWYFNQNMVDDYDLGNMYDLVESGGWTADKMMEYGQIVAADVNTDGTYDLNDRYGVSGGWDKWGYEACTAGYQYLTWKEDGSLVLTGMTDDLSVIHEKVWKMQTANYHYSSYVYGAGSTMSNAVSLFTNDQLLYMCGALSLVESAEMRDFGEYGILPSPKYLENQDTYRAFTTAYIATIPFTAEDYDTSALVLTALEAQSYELIRPAYYDTALSYKYLNDPQAMSVLDMLTGNVVCEMSYNWAQSLDPFLGASVALQENLASWMKQEESRYNALAQEIVDAIMAMGQ